ncbi:MAG TPA: metallophosphoesterase [Casimicrobium sp.]|mgnify:CR=1 FL=1|nr:metallophosphoesterase [Casimicrobium sp.]
MSNTDSTPVLVMIVDDQLESAKPEDARLDIYKKWLKHVSDVHHGKWTFDFHYCSGLDDVAKVVVAPGQPYLSIVDMVLEGVSWPTTAVDLLNDKLLDEKWPMILVSGKFDSPEAIVRVNRLIGKLDKATPCQFLTWTTIKRATDGFDADNVAFIVGAVLSRARNQDLRFKKGLDDPIDILHITDPHFGKATWDVGALISLRRAREVSGLAAADFLAITGDVADRGTPAQYQQAYEYFEALANNRVVERVDSGLPKDRVFMCPGNHDFSRPIALAANISNTLPYAVTVSISSESEWIRPYSWTPYYEFETKMTGQTHKWIINPGFRVNTRFASSGLIILELNVERYAIEDYQDGIAEADLRASINAAVAAVENARKNSECVLVLAHRHESNAWLQLSQMIQSNLQGLATAGPLVFLCGHEHSPEVSTALSERALFVRGVPPNSGPTLPKLILPMINCVRLLRKNGAVVGAEVQQFHQQATAWLVDDEGPKRYDYRGGKWPVHVR